MTMSRLRPPHIEPCDCNGDDRVDLMHDGISVTYICASCRSLLADVIEGAEP